MSLYHKIVVPLAKEMRTNTKYIMNNLIAIKDPQIIQQNKILLGGQGINLRARQLVYIMASLMDKQAPTDFIRVSAKDFLTFINKGSKGKRWSDVYALTNDIFDHLNEHPILIKKPRSKDFKRVNWLSSLGVSGGMVEARFSADIADYFLFKQGLPYTKLLWDLRSYHSNFTVRILDLFQKFHIKESGKEEIHFEYSLEELKFFFGVQDRYARLYDFEKRVLKVTQSELDKNDDAPYWFEYEKVKSGKTVKIIKFVLFVRKEALLRKIPNLRIIKGDTNQPSLFSTNKIELSKSQKELINKLIDLKISETLAIRVISSLTETQSIGYCDLVAYGVNRNLAYAIVKDHCSFGELVGYEHLYIQHSLDLIEKARIKRITDAQNGQSKKRTTPKERRGGLAKKVFEDKQHFASFMEKLSSIRHNNRHTKKGTTNGMKDLGSILNNLKKTI